MSVIEVTQNITSKNWLRMPVAVSEGAPELFVLTGIAVFEKLKGTGQTWNRGTAIIHANFSNIVPIGKAIQPKHWTCSVSLASVNNKNESMNTGWAVDESKLPLEKTVDGIEVILANGVLVIRAEVAIRDIDAFIARLSFNVSILGKVVDYQLP
ncbi:MAG: hypothetical protein OZ930_11735 [Ignavibacteria bacterium]|nr:hypothetical protein [Ignavibacteria bacterium]